MLAGCWDNPIGCISSCEVLSCPRENNLKAIWFLRKRKNKLAPFLLRFVSSVIRGEKVLSPAFLSFLSFFHFLLLCPLDYKHFMLLSQMLFQERVLYLYLRKETLLGVSESQNEEIPWWMKWWALLLLNKEWQLLFWKKSNFFHRKWKNKQVLSYNIIYWQDANSENCFPKHLDCWDQIGDPEASGFFF